MKRFISTLALCALALSLLCGCASVFDRSYLSVTDHQEQATAEDDSSILQAETYADLVSCVQRFVSLGQSTGTVHLYKYTDDVDEALEQACNEVLTEDPLGAYALEQIDYSSNRIVSYYECTFTFTYRRTLEEMDAITTIYGYGSIRDLIQSQMSQFISSFAFRTISFYADRTTLYNLAQEAYYASPETALGYPELSISIYPNSGGDSRIVELTFHYSQSQEELQWQAQEVEHAVEAAAQWNADDPSASLWQLYTDLLQRTTLDANGSASVYSALCQGRANSEGLAQAFVLLCQRSGIPCQLVQGTLDGRSHCWNLITIGGVSWQLDLTRGDLESDYLRNDEQMLALEYVWDQDSYPACTGDALNSDPFSPLTDANVEFSEEE